MPASHEKSSRVAIVGASSLRGKELKLVLEERNFPASEIVLLDESVVAGTLTEAAGEPTFIRALDPDSFEGVHLAFFAGLSANAEANWKAAQRAGTTVIDLTGTLAADGRTTTSIPSLAQVLPPHFPTQAGSAEGSSAKPALYSSPASPVIIACTLAASLVRFAPQRVMLLFFPPVSERDQLGVDELETQTTNLLSFQPTEQKVFDVQVAFNLLSAYGESSKPSLGDTRAAIARDVARFLADRAPIPAIQLVQAPVFYGYAFAAYAEFPSSPPAGQLESSLANLRVKIAAAGDPAPTNVSVAGESEIQLAEIKPDPNVANAVWLWGVADNLRIAATNAARIAEELTASAKSAS